MYSCSVSLHMNFSAFLKVVERRRDSSLQSQRQQNNKERENFKQDFYSFFLLLYYIISVIEVQALGRLSQAWQIF